MSIKLVLGAGEYHNNPGWIHTHESEVNLLSEKDWSSRFQPASISAIIAEHVLEHLTYEEGLEAMRRCYRYLKPGGHFRCAVPDGYFPDEGYQRVVQVGGPGPRDHPAAGHKILYTYKTLSQLCEQAGFMVRLLEYFDEEGDFHAVAWEAKDGVIYRSRRIDPRNSEKMVFPSLIVDAMK
ncbi:methyltransferase domain-containing protein [Mechercharimyces sp. CAU 1602]|uniref:class I SAM-dependent methyltransferase n=1 Tax=Mechercharimyces sp. CAU 1602 TaxID=2973933 RepID=UPI002162BE17|nr:methyltransferase domain-containing protein [Mechercharimyces sp. CAU 1602]MCS1351093.1 methyltransferase domain-containing protein [Mechercharimyces sp. CAU 1602]